MRRGDETRRKSPGLGVLVAPAILLFLLVAQSVWKSVEAEQAREEAVARGIRAAEEDLANGTPWIRRPLDCDSDVTPEGLGIDQETGLPFSNTAYWCATCMDPFGGDEDRAYNARILKAGKGALAPFSLAEKVRTRRAIDALFGASQVTRLDTEGETLRATAEASLVYHGPDEYAHVAVVRPGKDPEFLRTTYPLEAGDRPEHLSWQNARGPFDAIVVDEGTTAIVRDAAGYTWTIDVPRAHVVQLASPIRK